MSKNTWAVENAVSALTLAPGLLLQSEHGSGGHHGRRLSGKSHKAAKKLAKRKALKKGKQVARKQKIEAVKTHKDDHHEHHAYYYSAPPGAAPQYKHEQEVSGRQHGKYTGLCLSKPGSVLLLRAGC